MLLLLSSNASGRLPLRCRLAVWVQTFPRLLSAACGEKISCGGGACGPGRGVENFLTPGGVCKDPRARVRCAPVRPSVPPFCNQLRDFLRLFFRRSCMVFRLWQLWQRLCRLPGSKNRFGSPLWSTMWSTSVARTRRPIRSHSAHHGSFAS